MVEIIAQSKAQTRTLGRQFARLLRGGEVLAVSGELGSGKTTFVKGLASGLGIKAKIKSPTFVIFNIWPVAKKKLLFYHFDLYRLGSSRDLSDLGFTEIVKNKKHITVIEWPAVAKKLLPKRTIYLKFSHDKQPPNNRTIRFS